MGGLRDRLRKVISELLILLLKTVFSSALVGYFSNWFLAVSLQLWHKFCLSVLCLKAFRWNSDGPIPCKCSRKRSFVPIADAFSFDYFLGCKICRECLLFFFFLLPQCQWCTFLQELCCGAAWACQWLLSLVKQGAVSIRITLHTSQVTSLSCCGSSFLT